MRDDDDRTKYPRGSPRDILVRLRRIEKDIREQLREVRAINADYPNSPPVDVGRYLIQLRGLRELIPRVVELVKANATRVPAHFMAKLIADIEPHLNERSRDGDDEEPEHGAREW